MIMIITTLNIFIANLIELPLTNQCPYSLILVGDQLDAQFLL